MTWENLGAIATAALAAAGGTSGIIIDNTVGSGTLAGASQVYFSTLSNQDLWDVRHTAGARCRRRSRHYSKSKGRSLWP